MRSLKARYFLPRGATILVYMLQNVEYQPRPYLRWFWRAQDFSRIMYRRQLDATRAANLLRVGLLGGMGLQLVGGLLLLVAGITQRSVTDDLLGGLLVVSYPLLWAHLVILPLLIARHFIVKPRQARLIAASRDSFANHSGLKIAVAGSYGKTSMKELLAVVLAEGKRVAVTPANKNVASSHAAFAQTLSGEEEVVILEFGEGEPGDVRRFSETTRPTHGIITGLAPAHLDRYKTVQAAGEDIFELANYLGGNNVYVNGDSTALQSFIQPAYHVYTTSGVLGWKVSGVTLSTTGVQFELHKGRRRLRLSSGLLGTHQVGPLSLAAILGLEIGLSEQQVINGVAKTLPFEHRMQPYQLGGAWIIDDTYNGNLEGVRVGTGLLSALSAQRKWYVTPGLVEQGKESSTIHEEMGRLIAGALPDIVVLMQNSATTAIQTGLTQAGFKGELRIETAPLDFYTNLEHQVAAGDLVLMQNDWTDNYQ